MKKFLIGVVAIIFFLIMYWKIEAYTKNKIYVLHEGATGVDIVLVEENHLYGWIINRGHIASWNYTYTIKDRNLYLQVYSLSFLNPEAEHAELKIDIDVGYNDFDNIYIDNGADYEPILIWESKNAFYLDKLSDLNVKNNEFSCKLNYPNWKYKCVLIDRELEIRITQSEEENENGLEVKFDKGYDDFDKVSILGLGNQKAIWSKTE
jgi:hypothetical protein